MQVGLFGGGAIAPPAPPAQPPLKSYQKYTEELCPGYNVAIQLQFCTDDVKH